MAQDHLYVAGNGWVFAVDRSADRGLVARTQGLVQGRQQLRLPARGRTPSLRGRLWPRAPDRQAHRRTPADERGIARPQAHGRGVHGSGGDGPLLDAERPPIVGDGSGDGATAAESDHREDQGMAKVLRSAESSSARRMVRRSRTGMRAGSAWRSIRPSAVRCSVPRHSKRWLHAVDAVRGRHHLLRSCGTELHDQFVVDDVRAAIERVREDGAEIAGDVEDSEFGAFGWFVDPDSNRVELWQRHPRTQGGSPALWRRCAARRIQDGSVDARRRVRGKIGWTRPEDACRCGALHRPRRGDALSRLPLPHVPALGRRTRLRRRGRVRRVRGRGRARALRLERMGSAASAASVARASSTS